MSNINIMKSGKEDSSLEKVEQILGPFSTNVRRVENELNLQGNPEMTVDEFANLLDQLSPEERIQLEYVLITIFGFEEDAEESGLLANDYAPAILRSLKYPEVRSDYLTMTLARSYSNIETDEPTYADKWAQVFQFIKSNEG